MFRICSEFSAMFRICSEFSVMFRIFSNFQNLFRIFSKVQNLFRILLVFRIFRHFSEYLAQKLVYSESLDFAPRHFSAHSYGGTIENQRF
jgi:hypothetical protein